MSSLVLLGEQPSAQELAVLLQRLGGGAGLAALAKDGKLAALLDTGVAKQSALLLAASDEDLTAALTLSFAVLAQLQSAAEAAAAAHSLAALLTSDPSQRALLKIRILTNLINVLGGLSTVTPAQRFQMLLQLLQFALAATSAAGAASPAALVLQPLPTLHAQIAAWKLSQAEASALLLASYKLAAAAGPLAAAPKSVRAKGDEFAAPQAAPTLYSLGAQPQPQHEYLFAVLKSLDGAAPAALQEKAHVELALQAAVSAAANGLASTLHTLDAVNVFPLAAVQALAASNSTTHAAAFKLLQLQVEADLSGYLAFEKSAQGAALLKEFASQLDAGTLQRKMRTLALAAMAVEAQAAASSNDNVLTYAAIQSRLQLPAGDAEAVEAAVIDAVMAGRVDAKMDQDAETLCVKSVAYDAALQQLAPGRAQRPASLIRTIIV